MQPAVINAVSYSKLVHQGFRRTGEYVYRPCCVECKACVSVRVLVACFTPNRAQKRVQRAHSPLLARTAPFQYSVEHHRLYQRYQIHRHGASSTEDAQESQTKLGREHYESFLLRSGVESRIIEFREPDSAAEPGALRMVSLMDIVSDGLSCVYTFYDPDILHASYGTYNILWHIAQARLLQLPHVYLGYWIQDSVKMAYKVNFQPIEGYVEKNWVRLAK